MARKVIIKSHRSVYYLRKGKDRRYLCYRPANKEGAVDRRYKGGAVELSPRAFRAGHNLALLKLGVKDRNERQRILSCIDYDA